MSTYYEEFQLPHPDFEGLLKGLVIADRSRLFRWILGCFAWFELGVLGKITASNHFALLSGVPGVGKSTLIQGSCQLAASVLMSREKVSGLNFIRVRTPLLFQKYQGETAKRLHEVFQLAIERTAGNQGVIVVFDDAEQAMIDRQMALQNSSQPMEVGTVPTLLFDELDRLRGKKRVFVIACTNMLDVVDKAILTRADILVKIPLPNECSRQAIWKELFSELDPKLQSSLSQVHERDFEELVNLSQDMSGREIRHITIEALSSRPQLISSPAHLSIDDFLNALRHRRNESTPSSEHATERSA